MACRTGGGMHVLPSTFGPVREPGRRPGRGGPAKARYFTRSPGARQCGEPESAVAADSGERGQVG